MKGVRGLRKSQNFGQIIPIYNFPAALRLYAGTYSKSMVVCYAFHGPWLLQDTKRALDLFIDHSLDFAGLWKWAMTEGIMVTFYTGLSGSAVVFHLSPSHVIKIGMPLSPVYKSSKIIVQHVVVPILRLICGSASYCQHYSSR